METSVNTETESPSGLKIIDNLNIKKGSESIDVLADPGKIRESVLSRVKEQNPVLLTQARQLLDKLTISFGARPIHAVQEEVANRYVERCGIKDGPGRLLASIIASYNETVGGLNQSNTAGFFFYDAERPLLYINTAGFKNEPDFKKTWDHEIDHIIYELDPHKRQDNQRKNLSRVSLALGINLAADVSALELARAMENVGRKDKISRREFLRQSKDYFLTFLAVGSIPAGFMANSLIYSFFSPEENSARKAAISRPTDDAIFKEMIKVIKK